MAKINDIRTKFDEKVLKFLNENKALNIRLFTKVKYEDIIREVKEIKQLKENRVSLVPKQYRRLNRYDIKVIGGIEKLIENKKNEGTGRHFCHTEELFDVLHEIHVNSGHKKTRVMDRQLKKQYCNITREIINIYITFCKICHDKKQESQTGFVVKSKIINSCCYFDILNMQTHPDGQYQFILYYQDHATKFIILRPLTTMSPYDVAQQLVDIFCLFGTPCILRSDNKGQEYVRNVIQSVAQIKRGTKLVYGTFEQSSSPSQNQCLQQLRGKVLNWMSEEKTGNWSQGLRFIQNGWNRCMDDTTKSTPYEAMFGNTQRISLEDSPLPIHVYDRLETEEDLEKAIDDWNDKNEAEEATEEGNSSSESPKRKKNGKRAAAAAPRNKKPKEVQNNDILAIPEGNLRSEIESAQEQFYATNPIPGCYRNSGSDYVQNSYQAYN